MFGDWPSGEGEMAARIRAFDWSGTPLGPLDAWPQSLRSALDICLGSGFPAFIAWGAELTQIYNDAALPVVGAKHPELLGTPAAAGWREIWADVGPLIEQARDSGRTATRQDLELQLDRGGGPETAYFTVTISPLRNEAAVVAGVMVVAIDTTVHRSAVAALRESEERFRQFAEAASDLLWIRDADSMGWEFVSPSFEDVYGLPVDTALSGDPLETWNELVIAADRAMAMAVMRKVRAGERVTFEYRIQRPDSGELRWIRDTAFPIRDDRGRVRRIGGVGYDVTEEKEAARHQAMLLAELQHRTRNLLGVIRVMARRTAETSEDIESFLTHFDGRLSAVARAQTALTRNEEVSAGLDDLILEEFLAAAGADQVTLEGPEVQLNGKVAESISLAVHELVTNALKYGALTTPKGHVHVTWALWDRAGQTVLALEWRETGVGVIDVQPRRMGFGRRLLEKALPYELGAETTLRFAPGGVFAHIDVPLRAPGGKEPTGG